LSTPTARIWSAGCHGFPRHDYGVSYRRSDGLSRSHRSRRCSRLTRSTGARSFPCST
jgi:hypothetical protein